MPTRQLVLELDRELEKIKLNTEFTDQILQDLRDLRHMMFKKTARMTYEMAERMFEDDACENKK